ncbi:MAG: pyridoxine 5'-phosphate synthase [Aquificaceae bacterium]
MRLGVNIDHVATLRQVRKTFEPSPVFAALIVQQSGADQVTFHLREDRRHIQDSDLEFIKNLCTIPINLEMAPLNEMKLIALRVKPDRVTLVPERREEITTEGGLDVSAMKVYLTEYVKDFLKVGIEVSLFVEPEGSQIIASKEVGAHAVEFHTGRYASLWANHRFDEAKKEIERIKKAGLEAKGLGLKVYAGHGLTYYNVKPFVKELSGVVEEINVGHSIVSNSVIFGLERAIKEFMLLMKE